MNQHLERFFKRNAAFLIWLQDRRRKAYGKHPVRHVLVKLALAMLAGGAFAVMSTSHGFWIKALALACGVASAAAFLRNMYRQP